MWDEVTIKAWRYNTGPEVRTMIISPAEGGCSAGKMITEDGSYYQITAVVRSNK